MARVVLGVVWFLVVQGTWVLGMALFQVSSGAEGWQVVFQIIEEKRMMLFWKREAVIVTLGR